MPRLLNHSIIRKASDNLQTTPNLKGIPSWRKAETKNCHHLAAGRMPYFCLFLDASSHLYKRVCPSVRPSVRPSVGPSVRPSVRMSRFCKTCMKLIISHLYKRTCPKIHEYASLAARPCCHIYSSGYLATNRH